jgi:hypothetical protein
MLFCASVVGQDQCRVKKKCFSAQAWWDKISAALKKNAFLRKRGGTRSVPRCKKFAFSAQAWWARSLYSLTSQSKRISGWVETAAPLKTLRR